MSDLEKFLQQAAQRMKERQQAAGRPANPQQSDNPRPQQTAPQQRAIPPQQKQSRPQEKKRPPNRGNQQPEILQAEIVQADVVQDNFNRSNVPREAGPDRLSSLDTRPHPGSKSLTQADERMASRVQQVFDHGLGQLSQKPAIKVPETGVTGSDQTNQKTEVSHQKQASHPMQQVLRNPDTLRAAFVAGEIFRRKFS